MMDFQVLIPELAKWNNGKGISVELWINGLGNFEHAIAYGRLFWPDFVEYDGCIFLSQYFDIENYNNWMKSTKGNKTAVEKVMNHRHIVDYFPNSPKPQPTKEQMVYFGNYLKELWDCKLKRDFPERNIVVEFFEGEDVVDDVYDFEILFYQNR